MIQMTYDEINNLLPHPTPVAQGASPLMISLFSSSGGSLHIF